VATEEFKLITNLEVGNFWPLVESPSYISRSSLGFRAERRVDDVVKGFKDIPAGAYLVGSGDNLGYEDGRNTDYNEIEIPRHR